MIQVDIVTFPQTRVAALKHTGSPAQEHETARKLVAWKLENKLTDPSRHRHYGLHYADPGGDAARYRVDFCLSVDEDVPPNPFGILSGTIPALRCALARDIGSRRNNQAARYLYEEWLPGSGEAMADFPLIFHYVNVGPGVKDEDAITDVYLPLK